MYAPVNCSNDFCKGLPPPAIDSPVRFRSVSVSAAQSEVASPPIGPLGDAAAGVDPERYADGPTAMTSSSIVRRVSEKVCPWLVALGLALSTSDRFLAIRRANLTLKPSYVLFAAALLLALLGGRGALLWSRLLRFRTGAFVLVGIGVLYGLATLAGASVSGGVKQLVTIAGGAIVPCLALLSVVDVRSQASALRWYIVGTLVGALYGGYQLTAFYQGWPQGIPYVGTTGEIGRFSSFAYEPAYFGVSLTVLMPLLVRDAGAGERRLHPTVPASVPLVMVIVASFMVNARSLFFSVPIAIGVGVIAFSRGDRASRVRACKVAGAGLLAGFVLFVGVAAWRNGSVGGGLATASKRGTSVTNTAEAESNAPRLETYRWAVRLVRKHPVLGLGPGRGFDHGLVELGVKNRSRIDQPPDRAAVVNNVWLQAAIDAGLLAPVLGAALCALLLLLWWRNRTVSGALVLAGGLIVMLINGMLISFQWDLRVWAAIGLGLALLAVHEREEVAATS